MHVGGQHQAALILPPEKEPQVQTRYKAGWALDPVRNLSRRHVNLIGACRPLWAERYEFYAAKL